MKLESHLITNTQTLLFPISQLPFASHGINPRTPTILHHRRYHLQFIQSKSRHVGGSGHAVLEQAGKAVEDLEIRSRARASGRRLDHVEGTTSTGTAAAVEAIPAQVLFPSSSSSSTSLTPKKIHHKTNGLQSIPAHQSIIASLRN
ncbi:hypothetical protein AKJ16_DCAP25755 [Drosera capensis]